MRYLLFLLLLLPGGGSSSWAQTPVVVQSQRRFGSRINLEEATAITYTRHHRLAVVGNYQIPNVQGSRVVVPSSLWLLNGRGDSLTTVSYPYTLPDGRIGDYGIQAVAEAANGDLLMLGNQVTALSPNSTTANVLLRTDSLGVLKWVRSYPGRSSEARAIQPLPDNGALLVTNNQHPLGTANYPIPVPTVIRVDSLGASVWQHSYGQPYNTVYSITPLADGSYALAGIKETGPPQWQAGGWVLRISLNQNGDTLRSRVLGGLSASFQTVAAAPGGGLVLGGIVYNTNSALVVVTDSLDRVVWQRSVVSTVPGSAPVFTFVRALQRPGQVLVAGERAVPVPYPFTNNYLAVWQAPATVGAAATPVWEQQLRSLFFTYSTTLLAPTEPGSMVGVADYGLRNDRDLRITRFANVPAIYEPPFCRTPPYAAPLLTPVAGTNQFSFSDISLAGPPYAQLVAWRWDFGDGSPPYFGRTPPPHAYAALTPATALRLTVTNNLGCTNTVAVYPFLLPTRPGQARPAATLHPNPAGGGAVRLTVPGLRPQPPVAGELRNAIGQLVQRGMWPVAALAQGAALDVAGLPAGVYTLRLLPHEGPVTLRLVRE